MHRIRGAWADRDVVELPSDSRQLWYRMYPRGGPYPTEWNVFRDYGPLPGGGRFDPHGGKPGPSDQNVLYLADSITTVIAEGCQERLIDPADTRDRYIAEFLLEESVRVLDLRGAWPTRAGASQLLVAANHSRPQRYARVLYREYVRSSPRLLDGVMWRSSMDGNGRCLALWNCESALPATPDQDRSLADPTLRRTVTRAAGELGYDLAAPTTLTMGP